MMNWDKKQMLTRYEIELLIIKHPTFGGKKLAARYPKVEISMEYYAIRHGWISSGKWGLFNQWKQTVRHRGDIEKQEYYKKAEG